LQAEAIVSQGKCADLHLWKFFAAELSLPQTTLDRLNPAITGAAAIAVAAFTYFLYVATKTIWQHTQAVERAYVKLSHSAPGVRFIESELQVTFEVRNTGHTPATVSDAIIKTLILSPGESLPSAPDYAGAPPDTTQAFLTSGDKVFLRRSFPITDQQSAALRSRGSTLFFFGYVDYVDVFGQRHRGGYARRYLPELDVGRDKDKNNLAVVANRAYNYDRVRKSDEGTAW
jgi:hypothetical protein